MSLPDPRLITISTTGRQLLLRPPQAASSLCDLDRQAGGQPGASDQVHRCLHCRQEEHGSRGRARDREKRAQGQRGRVRPGHAVVLLRERGKAPHTVHVTFVDELKSL